MNYRIRHATDKDREDLTDIFNYYIEKSYAAFFDRKVSPVFFERLQDIVYGDSFYVTENEDGQAIGFGLLKQYHPSGVFRRVAEVGYFLRPECTGKGLGTRMLKRLISDARKMKIKTLLASISSRNEESISFHKKYGFIGCGRFKSIGQKYGKTFDVVWMQKDI
jgi:L-amino acid N-acyltransferase YncA